MNNNPPRGLRAAVAAALLLSAAVAVAGVIVSKMPTSWQRDGVTYPSEAACVEAAKAALGGETLACSKMDRVLVRGDCSDVPAPSGFIPETLPPTECPNDPNRQRIEETYQARDDNLYPVCWEVRRRVISDCNVAYGPREPLPSELVDLPPVDPPIEPES